MKRKLLVKLNVLLVALVASSSVHAIPMQDLFSGASLVAGDKLFDQWTLNILDASDPALVPDLSQIEVTPLNDGGSDPGPGLDFFAGSELRVVGDSVFSFIELSFGFRVSTLNNDLIKDNTLSLTAGLVTLTGDNGSFISESIGTAPTLDDLGFKAVEFSFLDPQLGGSGLTQQLTDSAEFLPQPEVFVTKNIFVYADDGLTAATESFRQRFSQAVPVPAPPTIALLVLGVAACGAVRRRRVGTA